MYKIVTRRELAPNVKFIEVEAKDIAAKVQPGQFVILRLDEPGERIPLTVADFNRSKGTISIIFQEVGKTTKQLGLLQAGENITNIVGPLGQPTHIEKVGTVVCVGGGVGTASMYPITRAFKETGNKVITIIGGRSQDYIIWEKEIGVISDTLIVTTDDGSYGEKGLATKPLEEMIRKKEKIDLVIAIGPVIMMKAVSHLTKSCGIKTIVSLNPIMLDGTGMCGVCRVEVNNETRFACFHGPDFDGHLVNFDLLMHRLKTYPEEEKISLEKCEHCRK
ncbi:MAG: sulfide/dihydroorotate dehydrogenase-like FAD/NAD-binding protein [bacterium]|nr:sulfide/dihydroorotate dehydrogenase-like FAD/NAD-binding protein [bacterium]MDD5354413.1 sulfide/dihydroorotate dehydrogenase-like FAD/NAD-binding protein [bacterium]MDD5757099.1 sulfide/dihydroorotate dehydrogenase-like FAD/NAD-binding protein [bacterium]